MGTRDDCISINQIKEIFPIQNLSVLLIPVRTNHSTYSICRKINIQMCQVFLHDTY